MGSDLYLMNSISKRFPNGLGNDSGELGHNIIPTTSVLVPRVSTMASRISTILVVVPTVCTFPDSTNIGKDKRDYLRGFGHQGGASRQSWSRMVAEMSIG